MAITIALAGNPNSGKTTMFNNLTGSSQYVGNWPGVTVEKKEGKYKGNKEVVIVDLPGIYSLSPYTLEEVVTRKYLVNEKPDVIINIVDASNLERNLYLTTQLLDMGIPVIVALNMIDVVRKRGDKIDLKKLEEQLGCKVLETSALKSLGTKEVAEAAISLAGTAVTEYKVQFGPEIENALKTIGDEVKGKVDDNLLRWYSIKIFERDEAIWEQLRLTKAGDSHIESIITKCEETMDDDGESIIISNRYSRIHKIVNKSLKKKDTGNLTVSDKIDKVVTNRWLALPIFAVVIWLVYYISISTVGTLGTDWVNDILFGEWIPAIVEGLLSAANTPDWLSSLVLDGIIGGIGAVLGFLPQMMVLFLCLAILEDCGYMSRIAFIMDRVFRKFGLSGKSFIPILVGTGCGVPGVMASRTIESETDRKMTIMTTTFIPCSAKLPIIALVAGALFPGSVWVAPSAYFVGIAAIICSGIILKKTRSFAGEASPFVMELPAYQMPSAKGVIIHMWDRAKSFVKKAGTVIFIACSIIWFTSSFNWQLQFVDTADSMLASIGHLFAPVFAPLGWGNWQAAVATITGLVAKENVVGTFGVLYGFAEVSEEGIEVWSTLSASFTQIAAYSFLVFNLLCAPCFAAIGAIKREMGTAKWTWIAIGYQTLLAYVTAFTIYQLGYAVIYQTFGFGAALAILIVIVFLYLLFRPNKYREGYGKKAPRIEMG